MSPSWSVVKPGRAAWPAKASEGNFSQILDLDAAAALRRALRCRREIIGGLRFFKMSRWVRKPPACRRSAGNSRTKFNENGVRRRQRGKKRCCQSKDGAARCASPLTWLRYDQSARLSPGQQSLLPCWRLGLRQGNVFNCRDEEDGGGKEEETGLNVANYM